MWNSQLLDIDKNLYSFILFCRGDGFFRVGGANVLWADIPVQNGVVHVVDKVLVGEAEGPW